MGNQCPNAKRPTFHFLADWFVCRIGAHQYSSMWVGVKVITRVDRKLFIGKISTPQPSAATPSALPIFLDASIKDCGGDTYC